MAIEVQTEFLSAASVRIWTFVKRNEPTNEDYVDPTAVTITVIDPDGTTQVDGVAMSSSATGIYYYDYHKGTASAAMATGRWRGTVKVVEGTSTTAIIIPSPFSFKVK